MRLIVGLGNPGGKYENTRHNVGFLIAQKLADKNRLSFKPSSLSRAIVAEGDIQGQKTAIVMPQTFMNRSGAAVRPISESLGIGNDEVLIVYDDFHLPLGQLRIRPGGSDGGHNGLHSVIYTLQSEEIARLRVGIGSPKNGQDQADYVLEEFDARERKELDFLVEKACDCCTAWLTNEFNEVMSQFNQKKEKGIK